MQEQTQKLLTAFLPKGCSHLLKAQSAAASEIYLIYFCPKRGHLSLQLPIHCSLMYHSTTNPYNQHCINTTFPPGRMQLALSFLIITLLIPRGSLPVPALSDPIPALPFCLALPFPQPFPIRAQQCPRLLFLSPCPPPAWHSPRRQHSAPAQL